MTKLERWLPFKFRRKSATEKADETTKPQAPAAAAPVQGSGSQLARQFPAFAQLLEGFYNDPFFRDPLARFPDVDRFFGDFAPGRFMPSVDVVDEETALRVAAELPGMSKDDVQLRIDDDALVIRGEKRNVEERKENGVYRTERYYGSFHRVVPLPSDVDRDKAAAEFKDGVLTVRFPKLPQGAEKARTIAIKAS